jgi:hypothetical protein
VGYEISYALEHGKPVICLYRRGVRVSKMLTGNTMPGIQVLDYGDIEEGVRIIEQFVSQIEAK